jgi:hypothetical protein
MTDLMQWSLADINTAIGLIRERNVHG